MNKKTLSTVVVANDKNKNKFALLEEVIEKSNFLFDVERKWVNSGKQRDKFIIAIKPNFMNLLKKEEDGIYTDTSLVFYLIKKLMQNGFENINVVEAQNVYSNYFLNREVIKVAACAGYFDEENLEKLEGQKEYSCPIMINGEEKKFKVIDLSLDNFKFDYKDYHLGNHPAGKVWAKADYRISFAKNKTHMNDYFSLTLKNVYGTLCEADGFYHYHKVHGVPQSAYAQLEYFPVDFAFIDATTGADGTFGFKTCPLSKKTGTIIGGKSFLAVDEVGAKLMGENPFRSRIFKAVSEKEGGLPEYILIGSLEIYHPWRKVRKIYATLFNLVEKSYKIFNFLGYIWSTDSDETFPRKKKRGLIFFRLITLYYLVMWFHNRRGG